jgi:hypothetical protein
MEAEVDAWKEALIGLQQCFYIDKHGEYDILYQRFPPAAIVHGVVFCDDMKHYKPTTMDIAILYFVVYGMLNDTIQLGVDNYGSTYVSAIKLPDTMEIGTCERRNLYENNVSDQFIHTLQINADNLSDATANDIFNGLGLSYASISAHEVSKKMTSFYKRLSAFLWRM